MSKKLVIVGGGNSAHTIIPLLSKIITPLLILLMVSRIAILLILRSPYRPRAIIISRLDKPKNKGVSVAFDVKMPVSERVFIPSGIAAESISSIDCLVI